MSCLRRTLLNWSTRHLLYMWMQFANYCLHNTSRCHFNTPTHISWLINVNYAENGVSIWQDVFKIVLFMAFLPFAITLNKAYCSRFESLSKSCWWLWKKQRNYSLINLLKGTYHVLNCDRQSGHFFPRINRDQLLKCQFSFRHFANGDNKYSGRVETREKSCLN